MEARERRQRALRHWVRWLPVAVLPLSVLFADAWLHTQNWRRDFDLGRLAARRGELVDQLAALEARGAGLQDLDRLAYMASNLGLVEPGPGQVVTVEAVLSPLGNDAFAVASTRPVGAAAPEQQTSSPALSVLEDIPESGPVRGVGLVTLETAEDDLASLLPALDAALPN